jgi:hypothetical protein
MNFPFVLTNLFYLHLPILQKFAQVLAMLPSVRVSEGSWSLMIQKILIGINNLLNDAFAGLEEGNVCHELFLFTAVPL